MRGIIKQAGQSDCSESLKKFLLALYNNALRHNTGQHN
ncbi:hypothetical protein L579_2873 [Pantoea sp. AS-PWVM4]|nr:hypothetical protein L579_2873 [Pantoea sp. AS-PWVM4]